MNDSKEKIDALGIDYSTDGITFIAPQLALDDVNPETESGSSR